MYDNKLETRDQIEPKHIHTSQRVLSVLFSYFILPYIRHFSNVSPFWLLTS